MTAAFRLPQHGPDPPIAQQGVADAAPRLDGRGWIAACPWRATCSARGPAAEPESHRGPDPVPDAATPGYRGVGASAGSSRSALSSSQKAAGIGWRKASTLARTCAPSSAPGMTLATDGWPSGNWSAAAPSGT